MSTTELMEREWTAVRRPGHLIALAAAALSVIVRGLGYAFANHSSCDGPCPASPVAADGSIVSDRFWFLHRDVGRDGSITVRLTSMTGTITYPPPKHDRIVPGLVPWAKAGIIVKDGTRRGSSYAALMLTGGHGVRFQYNYTHDIAGSTGGISRQSQHWLRLTRAGDTITGYESADGKQWHTVTAKLEGPTDNVRVGLFATSPGDLTLRKVGLGGAIEEVRFTQAVGVFDNVTLTGSTGLPWKSESVGEANHTDWEKYHNAAGAVEKDGVITVSGTGDIGPLSKEAGARPVEKTLPGLVIALIVVLIVVARYGARTGRETAPGRTRAARAVVGAAAFITGLVAVGVGIPVPPLPILTGVRIIAGLSAVLGLCALLTFAVGVLVCRGWAAILIGLWLIAVPYAIASVPLLPDSVARWLLRLTPAAGFAVQQTMVEYPQVTAHYAPSTGYFPLPGWAGLAVLCAYTLIVVMLALGRKRAADTDRRCPAQLALADKGAIAI
jgi:hypothetical protein